MEAKSASVCRTKSKKRWYILSVMWGEGQLDQSNTATQMVMWLLK